MGLMLGSSLLECVCFISLVVYLFYKHLTKNYDYWKRKGIPYKEPIFPYGSLKDHFLRTTHTGKAYDNAYKEFPEERFFGLIENGKPSIVVKDPDLVKRILVKDFQYFTDRAPPLILKSKESLALNLASLTGLGWKQMRHKLTPTFTSGKLKIMFELFEKCKEQLEEYLEKTVDDSKPQNIKNILGRFTMDIIASCAFGIETNSLEGSSVFINKISGALNNSKTSVSVQMMMLLIPSWLMRRMPISVANAEVEEFLTNVVQNAVEFRKHNNIKRNDFLNLLINLQQSRSHAENKLSGTDQALENSITNEGLTVGQMTAQAFLFFIGGFETTASLMSFCLFELARNQDVQQTLFEEIESAMNKNDGKLTYQLLNEIPFLDQVINETLRLYGSVSILTRSCTQPYHIPDSNLVLDKGVRVIIPSYSFHHDPKYYPDPYEFRPERFSPENSKERHTFLILPFGEGPRNCIGMRFGLLQTKLGLATIILNFYVHLAPEQEIPLKITPTSVVTQTSGPIWMMLKRR